MIRAALLLCSALTAFAQLNFDRIADRIVRSLALEKGERVIIRFDPGFFPELTPLLEKRIIAAGAEVASKLEYVEQGKMEAKLLAEALRSADVYLWMPYRENIRWVSPPETIALTAWLDAGGRHREIHFHWSQGSVLADGLITAHPPAFDKLYEDALEIDYAALSKAQDQIEAALRSGPIHITTPAGTNLEMRVGSRPMNKQNGDASARHIPTAKPGVNKVRVDREIELPAGVVRVAPEEATVNGTLVIPQARFGDVVARNIRFQIANGVIVKTDVAENREAVEKALKDGGPAALRFREIGIGANPKLALPAAGYPGGVIPYFAYGAGALRMSLGDNEELGGAVRGGFRRWFFFTDATVETPAGPIVRAGKLVIGAPRASSAFLIEPYLQLGDSSKQHSPETMVVLWQTSEDTPNWTVELNNGAGWKKAGTPTSRRIAVPGIEPHWVWRAVVSGLRPGTRFEYRISRAGEQVFQAAATARKAADQPSRFVAFGDCAQGTPGQREVAAQTLKLAPDYVFIPGDIVYTRGRISEYREKFFPYYNTTEAPLARSILFVAAPGNHDTASRDLTQFPDILAYFYYWAQPLNGPLHPAFEKVAGPDATVAAFRAGAGPNFPRMGSFSFDYGNVHWTVIDSNPYVDWTETALSKWIADDLAATKMPWKFVGFHHPGFNSSKAHQDEQALRKLSPVFEQGGVDVVISGHVHNYQRSWPLTFVPGTDPPAAPRRAPGKWTLDKTFDGKKNTHPKGVIYLVTGAGGAGLYDAAQGDDPLSWYEYTAKFVSKVHSMTVGEINGNRARFRQITANGEEVDSFTITK